MSRRFGFVSGAKSAAFAEAINKTLSANEGQITKTWSTLSDFQQEVNQLGRGAFDSLDAVIFVDKALDKNKNDSTNFLDFHNMQQMFLQKELYGIHLILFTASTRIKSESEEFYRNQPSIKYKGTQVVLQTDPKYPLKSFKQVFLLPFEELVYGQEAKDERKRKEQMEREKRSIPAYNRKFYRIMGKRDALLTQIKAMQEELENVNNVLIEYASLMQDDNLEGIESDLGKGFLQEAGEVLESIEMKD